MDAFSPSESDDHCGVNRTFVLCRSYAFGLWRPDGSGCAGPGYDSTDAPLAVVYASGRSGSVPPAEQLASAAARLHGPFASHPGCVVANRRFPSSSNGKSVHYNRHYHSSAATVQARGTLGRNSVACSPGGWTCHLLLRLPGLMRVELCEAILQIGIILIFQGRNPSKCCLRQAPASCTICLHVNRNASSASIFYFDLRRNISDSVAWDTTISSTTGRPSHLKG